jgi:hypothetical protein
MFPEQFITSHAVFAGIQQGAGQYSKEYGYEPLFTDAIAWGCHKYGKIWILDNTTCFFGAMIVQ